jgi:uncharacterized protein YdaU (DUF1376 family)
MHYYPRNISDYRRDTSVLTLLQHGAYTLLMDEAYDTERPLPSDPELLYRICRAFSKTEKMAVAFVVERYFQVQGGSLAHKRIDAEVAEYKEGAERNRANGRRGGRPKKPKDNPNETEKEPTGFLQETHSSSIFLGSSSEGKGGAGGKRNGAGLVETIVNAYPRRDSPMECMAVVRQEIEAGEEAETILQSVREIAALCNAAPGGADNQFIPRAKTFFTERQWRSPEAFRKRWDKADDKPPPAWRPPTGFGR